MRYVSIGLRKAIHLLLPLFLSVTFIVFQSAMARADSTIAVGLNPVAVVSDKLGNTYVANSGSGTVSRVNAQGSSVIVDLSPLRPRSLAVDSQNRLYVATRSGALIQVLADGTSTNFATVGKNPGALAFDSAGNLYSANSLDNSVSRITPQGVLTLYGRVGNSPNGMVFDTSGNLFTVNTIDGTVSKITPTGVVTSEFAFVGQRPTSITIDSANNLYVANGDENNISKVTPDGNVTTFATVGLSPAAITIDAQGNLYTANYLANTISRVTSSGQVSTFAITGEGPTAITRNQQNFVVANYLSNSVTQITPNGVRASAPRSLAASAIGSTSVNLSWQAPLDNAGSVISDYLVEATTDGGKTLVGTYRTNSNTSFTFPGLCSQRSYQLRAFAINDLGLSAASSTLSVTAVNGVSSEPLGLYATTIRGTSLALAWEPPVCSGGVSITDYRVSFSWDQGVNWTNATRAISTNPVATVPSLVLGRNYLFRVQAVNSFGTSQFSNSLAITTGETAVAVNVGVLPQSAIFDANRNLFVANTSDNSISRITSSGAVTRFASTGDNPAAMVFDSVGNLYTANSEDDTVSKISAQGVTTQLASVGSRPTGITIDTAGNLYTANSIDGTISKITPSGQVSTLADLGLNLLAIVIDSTGDLYTANGRDKSVSKITSNGEVSLLARLPIAASRILIDRANNLYAFSPTERTIYLLSREGAVSEFYVGSDSITDFFIDTNQNMFVANAADGTISRLLASGVSSTIAQFDDSLVRIASDGNGNIYSVFSEGKVARSAIGTLPTAPKSLTVSQITSTGLTLSWATPDSNGGSALIEYRVEQSADNGATWTQIAKSATNFTSVSVTALGPGRNYRFRVFAFNGPGLSPSSTLVSATTLAGAPGQVTNLVANLVAATSITLSWLAPETNGAKISDYRVEQSVDMGANWTVLTKSVSQQTSVTIGFLQPAKTYSYRVSAISSAGVGLASTSLTVTTLATVPSAPRSLSLSSKTPDSVSVSWLAPTADGGSSIIDYQLQLSSDNSNSWQTIVKPSSVELSYQITGLVAGAKYQLRVLAVNAIGPGALSNVLEASPATTVATSPRELKVEELSSTSIHLSWLPPTANGGLNLTEYLVEQSSDNGTTWVALPKVSASSSTFTASNLGSAKTYRYRVYALNSLGSSIASNTVTVTTLATTPAAPNGFTATSSKTSASIRWSAPSDGGATITDYQIELSSNGGLTWQRVAKDPSTLSNFTLINLSPSNTYSVRVSAVNSAGAGAFSEPFVFNTSALQLPQAPASIRFSNLKTTSVSVSWTAVTSLPKVTGYRLEIADANGDWKIIPMKVASATTVAVTGLRAGTSYQVRVAALNSEGPSTFTASSFRTIAIAPSPPTSLAATEIGANSIKVSWLSPTFDGGSSISRYLVEISGGGSAWKTAGMVEDSSNSLTIGQLAPATKYSFRVKAVNEVGLSKVSSTLVTTTLATLPGVPTNLTLKSFKANLATLVWTAPTNGGSKITDYRVEYSLDQGESWIQAPRNVSATPTFSIKNLKSKTSYLFRVTAKNSVGYSSLSAVLTLLTP